MKKWVTDYIGEAYKEWKGTTENTNNYMVKSIKMGDKIFISAPTGTGKTYFILNTLLPYFYSQNKKILFLVNRRILKEQMEKEISRININFRNNIDVILYQNLEHSFCSIKKDFVPLPLLYSYRTWNIDASSEYNNVQYLQKYECVICDECHYFLNDSNYNTNTIISFCIINKFFRNKIRIFLSATITDFQEYLINNEKNIETYRTEIYNILIPGITEPKIQNYNIKRSEEIPTPNTPRIKVSDGENLSYSLDIDYKYLDVHILNDKNDIGELVAESSDKWLIFVDNIDYGHELKCDLSKRLKDNDTKPNAKVSIITASYKKDEESSEQVKEIIDKDVFTDKVIISTSVMDNGINIKDIELRNMIIIADTKTEFIQMLGRKREDEKKLKLYIFKQTKNHFENRLKRVQSLLKIAYNYFSNFKNFFQKDLSNYNILDLSVIENYKLIESNIYLMNDIMNERIKFEDVKKLFLAYNGMFYLNRLSVKNLENLDIFYLKIIKRFDEEGENAFLREQLEWIGKTPEEIDDIIKNSSISTLEKYHNDADKKIGRASNKKMTKSENIDLKIKIKKEILYILDHLAYTEEIDSERKKYRDLFYKNDREISKPAMDFLRKYCDFPYEMQLINESENKEIKSKNKDKSVTYYMIIPYNEKKEISQ